MFIYTSRQGRIEITSLRALWVAQVGYLLALARRYASDIPPSLAWIQERLVYGADPPGRDTWYTPKEAYQRGKDDCEFLSNLSCGVLLSKGIPCEPVIGYFGGNVLHALVEVDPRAVAGMPLERWLWRRYPIVQPRPARDDVPRAWFCPSWVCGMGFPLNHLARVQLPQVRYRVIAGEVYCDDTL